MPRNVPVGAITSSVSSAFKLRGVEPPIDIAHKPCWCLFSGLWPILNLKRRRVCEGDEVLPIVSYLISRKMRFRSSDKGLGEGLCLAFFVVVEGEVG